MQTFKDTPILLVGGLAMKANEHEPLAGKLHSKLGRLILFCDNINVGNGPRLEPSKTLTILDQAQHQWNNVNKILGTESPISIYGISMGGMIASTMATLFPWRVKKLVLAATSANLSLHPSIPDELFNKWTSAKHEDDIREATEIAFGLTTIQKNPQVYEDYFQYRIKGHNQQKAKEFVQQLASIRAFDGAKVYSDLQTSGISTTVLAGQEDRLFDQHHLEDIKQLLPKIKFKEFSQTGHMLHLENLEVLAEYLCTENIL